MQKKKHINFNTLGYISICLLGILSLALLLPTVDSSVYATDYCKGDNGYIECDATARINTYAKLAPVVSIGIQGDVVLDVTPKSTGVLIEKPVNVTISTNSAEGYSLYMKALGSTNALTSTSPDNTNEISAVEGKVSSDELKTQSNVWGYNLSPKGSAAEILYQAVPVNQDTPVRVTDSGVGNGTDELELTFGMYVDTSLPSGVYSNAVLVSAVANPATISNLSELTFMQNMTSEICANTAYDADGSMDPANANTLNPVTKQLIDTRDGKKYWVSKLKDGKCWMVQDLKLDLEQGKTLSPANTNISEPWVIPVGTTHDNSENVKDTTYDSLNPGEYVFNYSKYIGRCVTDAKDVFSISDERCKDYATNISGWKDNFVADSTNTTNPDNKTYDAHYLIG